MLQNTHLHNVRPCVSLLFKRINKRGHISKAFGFNMNIKWKDTDIKDSHKKVRDNSYIVSFAFFGFSGRPV